MKIHSLDLLSMIAAELRMGGTEIVLANGCFDFLHLGHIKHLEAARKLGDCLMVTVTRDDSVNKGNGRPYFKIRERLQALAALDCVSYVTINSPVPGEAIKRIKPAVYVKGSEYKANMTEQLKVEKAAVESYGGRLVFTQTPEWHTSEIVKGVTNG